jgi:diguanylate cyclase (GGDEF)-like protein
MSLLDAAYLLLRFALAAFAGVMAVVTLQYAVGSKGDGRRWKVGTAGGILLGVAACFSVIDAIYNIILTPDNPNPISNWLWLIGFDFLLPLWALQLVRAWQERDRAEAALARLAETDSLTGIFNRRGFFGQATIALVQARRAGNSATAVMFDIDRFKAINDGYGHDAGDAVLRSLAAAVVGRLRPNSVFGRTGGEEFALLLPGSNLDQAAAAAERVRADIRAGVPHPAGATVAVTVSAGVAAVAETGGPEAAISAALAVSDAALYEAKRAGRDRVVINRILAPSIVPAIAR